MTLKYLLEEFLDWVVFSLPEIFTFAKNAYISLLGGNSKAKSIRAWTLIRGKKGLKIGKGTFLNMGCLIAANYGVEIGENVLIGPNVCIISFNHNYKKDRHKASYGEKIQIKKNVWIGANSVILPGSVIKEGCVIGAGSVVTRKLKTEPYCIYAGNPAKFLKKIKWRD